MGRSRFWPGLLCALALTLTPTSRAGEVDDVAALAARIDELLDDPEKRTRFGINGYSRTVALYSEKMYFQRLHALYKQVMDNGKANAYRLPGLARRPV